MNGGRVRVARELGRAGVRKVLQRTGIIEESVTSLPADPCEVVQLLDASWYEERLQKLAAELGRDPESVRAEECLQVGKQWELQRRIASAESRSMELFKTALRLARHRELIDGVDDPDIAGRRRGFADEIATAVRRVNTIAELARTR